MNKATIRLHVDRPEEAAAALAPDNDGFLEATVSDGVLVITTTADSTMGLLRSLDDALGCLRATGIE